MTLILLHNGFYNPTFKDDAILTSFVTVARSRLVFLPEGQKRSLLPRDPYHGLVLLSDDDASEYLVGNYTHGVESLGADVLSKASSMLSVLVD